MKRACSLFQGHAIRLAQPVNQQGHGGDEVVTFQQRFDDQREGLRRVEQVGVRSPEADIAGLRATLVPQIEALRHMLRRTKHLLGIHGVDAGYFMGGELPPPGGRLLELQTNLLTQFLLVLRRGRTPNPRKEPEHVFHQRDQFVGSMVVHTVLESRKQTEVRIEPQQIPRVDDRSTLNGPLEQIHDVAGQHHGLWQIANLDRLISGCQTAVDLAQHAGRRDRHDARLPSRRVRVPHAREDLGQVDVLQLTGAATRQPRIEMLASAAKRLTPRPRFLLQIAADAPALPVESTARKTRPDTPPRSAADSRASRWNRAPPARCR